MTQVARSKRQEKGYEKRQNTIEKKATELAILCDVPVCVLIKNIDGTVSTVPQDRGQAVDILMAYKRQKQAELKKDNEKTKVVKTYETRDPSFDHLPEEKLVEFMKELEEKSKMVDGAIRRQEEVIGKKGKGKRVQVGDGLTKIGNKKAKGVVLDSKVTNSSSSDSGLDSVVINTINSTDFSDRIASPKKLTEGMLGSEMDNGTSVEALHVSARRPVKLFGILLN